MAYNDNGGSFNREPRQMFKGDWKCAKCGAPITELPFEPDPSRLSALLCRDCHRERRNSFGGGRR
jgi:CxxC-x17-CxxC domain-containing protein